MRIHIRHEIVQAFEPPARFLNAMLRLTPRSHESQYVSRWRVEIDGDSRMQACDDAFGNCMHALSVTGQTPGLRIVAEGVVDTFDAAGIVRATVERFPPELYLRETGLTTPDERRRDLAAGVSGDNGIERLHALLLRVAKSADEKDAGKPEGLSQMQASAQQSQSLSHEDEAAEKSRAKNAALVHDFIVCARLIGAPARFVSGYYLDTKSDAGGAHCWAEAHVEGVGWIGFDPVNAICPHESHVRMAIGLDGQETASVRAAPLPISVTETVDVRRQS